MQMQKCRGTRLAVGRESKKEGLSRIHQSNAKPGLQLTEIVKDEGVLRSHQVGQIIPLKCRHFTYFKSFLVIQLLRLDYSDLHISFTKPY